MQFGCFLAVLGSSLFCIQLHVIILLFSNSFPWVLLFSSFHSVDPCMLRSLAVLGTVLVIPELFLSSYWGLLAVLELPIHSISISCYWNHIKYTTSDPPVSII